MTGVALVNADARHVEAVIHELRRPAGAVLRRRPDRRSGRLRDARRRHDRRRGHGAERLRRGRRRWPASWSSGRPWRAPSAARRARTGEPGGARARPARRGDLGIACERSRRRSLLGLARRGRRSPSALSPLFPRGLARPCRTRRRACRIDAPVVVGGALLVLLIVRWRWRSDVVARRSAAVAPGRLGDPVPALRSSPAWPLPLPAGARRSGTSSRSSAGPPPRRGRRPGRDRGRGRARRRARRRRDRRALTRRASSPTADLFGADWDYSSTSRGRRRRRRPARAARRIAIVTAVGHPLAAPRRRRRPRRPRRPRAQPSPNRRPTSRTRARSRPWCRRAAARHRRGRHRPASSGAASASPSATSVVVEGYAGDVAAAASPAGSSTPARTTSTPGSSSRGTPSSDSARMTARPASEAFAAGSRRRGGRRPPPGADPRTAVERRLADVAARPGVRVESAVGRRTTWPSRRDAVAAGRLPRPRSAARAWPTR